MGWPKHSEAKGETIVKNLLGSKFLTYSVILIFAFCLFSDVFARQNPPGQREAEKLLTEGKQLYADGEYEKAIAALSEALNLAKKGTALPKAIAESIYLNSALAYFASGGTEQGKDYLTKLFEAIPGYKIDEAAHSPDFVQLFNQVKTSVKPIVIPSPTPMPKKRKFPWLIVGGVVVVVGVAVVFLLKKKESQNASLTKDTITVTSPTNSTVWEKGFEVEIKWTTNSSVKNSLNIVKNGLVQVLSPNLASPSNFLRERMQGQALTNQGRDPEALRRNAKDLSGLGSIPGRIEGENPAGVIYPDKNKNDNVSSTVGKLNANPENLQLTKNFLSGSRTQIYGELWRNDKSPNLLMALNPKPYFSITNVNIDLYKGGTKVQAIVSSQSNTGSYKWIPPGSLADGTDYRVRISSSLDSSVYGESSNYSIATHTYQFINAWGNSGTGDKQFNNLRLIAVDSSGNVYVADSGNHRIQKFTSSGSFLATWGSQGTGNGQFNGPRGIAVDGSGNVFVGDTDNNRIQRFL
jgi:tetratricopeptide (TPR) repeat protein